jgi:opacity protein-like surface antigen
MKKIAMAAIAAVTLAGAAIAADTAEARRLTSGSFRGVVCSPTAPCFTGGGRRGRGTTVIQTAPGIDVNTLLLLGAMGGGATGGLASAALPLALLGAAVAQPTETVVTRSRRR